MKVIAWSRSLTPDMAEADGISYAASPEELAAQCDAVSIHLAYTSEMKHFVGAKFLDAMRPGAILVNTSRGAWSIRRRSARRLRQRGCAWGSMSSKASPSGGECEWSDKELAAIVTCTPHVGASTDQASEAVAAEVVRIVKTFIATGNPPGTVNLNAHSPARHRLVVRHYNRVGVLACVLDGLREEGINVEEMENAIFAGGSAACCSMRLDQQPSILMFAGLRKNENILCRLVRAIEILSA